MCNASLHAKLQQKHDDLPGKVATAAAAARGQRRSRSSHVCLASPPPPLGNLGHAAVGAGDRANGRRMGRETMRRRKAV